MKVYRVIDWDAHFENHKSRQFDNCSWVGMPNKQDGMGLTRILSESDGAAIYGIFVLIIGACSRAQRPREGWLTDDGRAHGRPWTVDDLSLRWRRQRDEVQRALDFLCSPYVGWIQELDASALEVPALCPNSTLEQNRTEQNRTEDRLAAQASSVAASGETLADPAIVLTFPTVRGKRSGPCEWHFRQDFAGELAEAFPDIDVKQEARKALAWINAGRGNRKTADGMKRFLLGWMGRAQNRGGSRVSKVSDRDDYMSESLKRIRGSNGS